VVFVSISLTLLTRPYDHYSAQEMNNSMHIPREQQKPYILHKAEPGQTHVVQCNKKDYNVRIIECFHSVPTVGYLFSEQRKKLKAEYVDKPGT
jgi:hypothetical protein